MSYMDTQDPVKVQAAVDRITEREPDRVAQFDGDARFAIYMSMIDRHVTGAIGLSYQDLPDYDFRGAYDAETTPRQVAMDLLEQEGFFNGE